MLRYAQDDKRIESTQDTPEPRMLDLIIRHGQVVTPDAVVRADVGVCDGKIVELAPDLIGGAKEEIDATGLHVFPGVVVPHVHFNEPGRTEWEGISTGS